jgi:outer membrane protein TolC
MKRYNALFNKEISKLLYLLLLTLSPLLIHAQQAITIDTLFNQLRLHPISKADNIKILQAAAFKNMANSQLYPTVDLTGRYDYSSIPSSMYPLPPNELLPMVQDQKIAQPFSKNIYRAGVGISMPLFVKSIFTIASQAQMLQHAAEDQQYINLLKNEAIIVSANANLIYLQQLDSSLEKKKSSLLKTKEIVDIKVKNGRSPGSVSININNAVNEIDILKNDLALQREDLIASIANLTGVTLTAAITMMQTGTYKEGEIKALDPLVKKIAADKLAVKAEKEKLLPSLFLQGNYSSNFAKAYNNNKSINGDYTTVGVVLKVPIFSKNQYAQINKSKLEVAASQNELDRMTIEFTVQAQQLENTLHLLENSTQLYTNSIKDKEELLTIATASYSLDQMTIDDYLKYEDDVVLEKTKLYKTQSQAWQTLMKLAVIYGNDIQNLVK